MQKCKNSKRKKPLPDEGGGFYKFIKYGILYYRSIKDDQNILYKHYDMNSITKEINIFLLIARKKNRRVWSSD